MKAQGQIGIYHPNGKGTGCAINIELHPAHDGADGSVFIRFAPQKTVSTATGEARTYPTFDWENAITARLAICEIAEVMQVFNGCAESLADGRGFFHRSERAVLVFRMEHLIEPCPGYRLEANRKVIDTDETQTAVIMLTPAEAYAIALALESSMSRIAFGD